MSIWTGSSEKLELFLIFLDTIDTIDYRLKFTIDIGGKELSFLDLKLILKDNKIQATVYSKPTDSHLYLLILTDSCHHLLSILGIQKVVTLRLRRICSTNEDFNNKSKDLFNW